MRTSNYMSDVSAVARDSDRVGRELERRADDARDQAGRAPEAARRPRHAAADRRHARRRARSARAAAGRAQRSVEALEFRADGLAGLAEAFKRTQGSKDAAAAGVAARLAGRAARRERRRLGRPLQGAVGGRAPAGREAQRDPGAGLQLRPDARPREHPLDGADLGADQRLGRLGDRRRRPDCTAPTSSR